MESTEALWMGDGIRVRADGALEDWAAHPGGGGAWVPYQGSLYPSDLRAPLLLMASQAKQLASFRQALSEHERGAGWEQAVLLAIDTRREVLAAVDEHVSGWDPARDVVEVVGHLAGELAALRAQMAEANRKRDWMAEEHTRMRQERNAAVAALGVVKMDREGVWFWEKGGENGLESLTCPVVMEAETLRELLMDAALPTQPAEQDLRRVLEMARAGAHVGDTTTPLGEETVQAVRSLKNELDSLKEKARIVTVTSGLKRDDAIEDLEEALADAHPRGERHRRHHTPPPVVPALMLDPDVLWTNGRIRVHRCGTVQLTPYWDAIQDHDLQALGAAMVGMLPASHAHLVAADVARVARRLGAEETRECFVAIAEQEQQHAREKEKAATNVQDTHYWDGRERMANTLKNAALALPLSLGEVAHG